MRATAFMLCGDWYLADDLVQDALARLYSVWGRVTSSGDPDAYGRRILVNLYLDYRRRPARREVPHAAVPTIATTPATDSTQPSSDLLEALREVPAGQRAVLVLRFWDDLSIEQTAVALNTSPGNVKSQTSRGLAALREALAARGLTELAIITGELS